MPEATEPVTPAGKPGVSVRALAILAVVAVLVYLADRLSKIWVVENLQVGRSVQVLGEVLQFTYVENSGAAFSIGSGYTWIIAVVASVAVVAIIVFARRIRSIAWALMFGMLLGGAAGNLTDRLTREPGFGQGHVVDFIHVALFPAIFNVADIFIVSSMGLFVLLTLLGVGLDGKRAAREPKAVAGSEAESSSPEP